MSAAMTDPKLPSAPGEPGHPDFKFIDGIGELAGDYDALICDVWGVLHDGTAAYDDAPECLLEWRSRGKPVALLSNAPRPGVSVARQLEAYGYHCGAEGHYDLLVTSGDATRAAIADGYYGRTLLHLGPERDLPLLDGLDLECTGVATSNFVLCTGLFDDEKETPGDYEGLLREMVSRDLPMLCANPDLTVMRGDKHIYCAGSLARAYVELGGAVTFFGKPYPGVYAVCLEQLAEIAAGRIDKRRVLAVGDGLLTDIAGGNRASLDTVLVAGGIHAAEFGIRAPSDPAMPELLMQACADADAVPENIISRFSW